MNKEVILGTLSQAIIYLAPIVSIPILFVALGEGIYSQIIFIQALLAIILITSEFGFTNYLIKNFSSHESSSQITVFNEIVSARLLFSIVGIGFSVLLLYVTNRLNLTALLLAVSLVNSFDCGSFAMINRKYERYSLLMGLSKFFYIMLLITFVNSDEDIVKFILISIFHQLPFFLLIHYPNLNFRLIKLSPIVKDSFYYFLPKLNQNLYLNIPVLANEFLGLPFSNASVGIPQKIFNSCTMVLNPLMSLIFRDMSISYNKKKINRLILYTVFSYLFLSLLLYLLAPYILFVLVGDVSSDDMLNIFRILLIFLPLMPVNMILGSSVLLANGQNRIILTTSFTALTLSIVLVLLNNFFEDNLLYITVLILCPKIIEVVLRLIYCIKLRYIL